MNKKFIFPLFVLFISSFFLLSSHVKADTISYTITSEQLSFTDNLPLMLDTVSKSSYSSDNFIIEAFKKNNSSPWEYVLIHGTHVPYLQWLDSWNKLGLFYNMNYKHCFSSDFSSLGSCSYYSNLPNWDSFSDLLDYYPGVIGKQLIYSSSDITLSSSSSSVPTNFNYSFSDKVYSFNPNTDIAPNLYILNNFFNSTPPDDTPILTNYYTLIFEKLGVLTNYFKNNPYLYAIPLIPIFILCIYLIKRSLIK